MRQTRFQKESKNATDDLFLHNHGFPSKSVIDIRQSMSNVSLLSSVHIVIIIIVIIVIVIIVIIIIVIVIVG